MQTGTYTKESKLSAVLDGINSSETAGVNASYDQETGSFVFTARKYGKDQRIEMGEGLADAMFGPPAGSDRSGESFATVYNFAWLNAGMSEKISAVTPGSKYGTTITTETTVQEVINSFNNSSMRTATFCYDKYTGKIAAKDNNNERPVQTEITKPALEGGIACQWQALSADRGNSRDPGGKTIFDKMRRKPL